MTEGWGFVWPDLLTSGEDEGLQAGFRRQAGDQPVVLCAQTPETLDESEPPGWSWTWTSTRRWTHPRTCWGPSLTSLRGLFT